MMNRKQFIALLCMTLLLFLLPTVGCGRQEDAAKPAASAEPTEAPAVAERADGERFEDVIVLEGMEETVKLQHIRNKTAGFSMDFDYESFVRRSESDRECFVSVYDDPKAPENYLEVAYCADDVDTVASAVSDALSAEYELVVQQTELDGAGACTKIDASAAADGSGTTEVMYTVYIIPASDGCRVATARYGFESADGFGNRFSQMVNTILVKDAAGERTLSSEQALAAVERCCRLANPDLDRIVSSGEYPVSWEVSESSAEQIVVLFRSYTGAEVRYSIDPVSGDARVTELVPAVSPEEQQTDEQINVRDYLDWWRA